MTFLSSLLEGDDFVCLLTRTGDSESKSTVAAEWRRFYRFILHK